MKLTDNEKKFFFGDFFPDWDDEKEVECMDCCKNEDISKYCELPLKEVLNKYKCSNCGSANFNILGDDFISIPAQNISFLEGTIVHIEYPLYGSYGGMAGMEILGYEEINSSPILGVDRQISSLNLGTSLISESYALNGNFEKASTMQDWLELSTENKLLPIKHIEEGKEIYRRVELERGITSRELLKNDTKWMLESESEWIYEIPYEHLGHADGQYNLNADNLGINTPKYELDNNGPRYTGFTNKTLNKKGDYQRFYIVDGNKQEEHPVWTFNKDHCLLSVDCKLGDDDFNLFEAET